MKADQIPSSLKYLIPNRNKTPTTRFKLESDGALEGSHTSPVNAERTELTDFVHTDLVSKFVSDKQRGDTTDAYEFTISDSALMITHRNKPQTPNSKSKVQQS